MGRWWIGTRANTQSKKHKTRETKIHQRFYKEYVKLMYINFSPMNIDLDDSSLLTFIFIFISLFVYRRYFLFIVSWVLIHQIFFFLMFIEFYVLFFCLVYSLRMLFLFIMLNGVHNLDGRLKSTIPSNLPRNRKVVLNMKPTFSSSKSPLRLFSLPYLLH